MDSVVYNLDILTCDFKITHYDIFVHKKAVDINISGNLKTVSKSIYSITVKVAISWNQEKKKVPI